MRLLWVPKTGRLYVAAPAVGGSSAAIRSYRAQKFTRAN